MEQILSVWNALEMRRRIIVIAATLGVFAAVLMLARIATTPGMSLLYAGLDGAQAGEVIQALDQRGQTYEVRGDAIYVASNVRDETRMALAAQGLPANSSTGYELLDGLSGFGTTAQMFDAAYWRAKEGELARTIMASPYVRFARVHIAEAPTQPFRRDSRAAASVTVTPAGAPLTPPQAEALRYLVASAVPGMVPGDVAVIDSNSGLVTSDDTNAARPGNDRAESLRANAQRLLEARVGAGHAVVEVNVDTVTDHETIRERRIDPASRVAVSQDNEQRTATSTDSQGAGVSVASNLPSGAASGGNGQSQSREQSTHERTSWDVSETSREVQRGPGAIRRMTVAVLVDGVRQPDANGVLQWQPRPEAELTALRELVASAVGLDETRGDVITLRSMQFEPVSDTLGTSGAVGWFDALGLDAMGLIRLGALAGVVLFLALFVLRPLLRPARSDDEVQFLPGAAPGEPQGTPGPALTGEIEETAPVEDRPSDEGPEPSPDPVERMRQLISERQDETLEILRNWMEEPEESR